jgi:TonB-linked SusC/RagA family outer membrane protein
VFSINANAQQNTVRGVVFDNENLPLPGVTVIETGTTNGVVSNFNGEYSIQVSSNQSQLEFSFIGMQSQIIPIQGKNEINITLLADVFTMDEVVVTALGISKESKSLGYAVTAVGSDELTEGGDKNMLNALQGKVAGVNITSSSGAPGASTRVLVRGVSSLSGGNQPLFIIDGVAVSNSSTGSSSINGGTDFGNKINDINMNDIESVSFLKGASGSALYGSRAANGVIIITTKKGSDKDKVVVSYSGSLGFEAPLKLISYQNDFGQGLYGNSVLYENTSWGPAFDNQYRPWGNTVDGQVRTKAYRALPNNVEEFFETGKSSSHSISLSGGNKLTTYYFSYSNVSWDGIFPTDSDTYKKHAFALRGSQKLGKLIDVTSSINYIHKSNSSVPTGQGNTSVYNQVMQTPRDISLLEQSDLSNPFNTIDNYYSLYTVNPYQILNSNENSLVEHRVYGSFDFDLNLPYEIKAKWRIGADISNQNLSVEEIEIDPQGNNENSNVYEPGLRSLSSALQQQLNSDIIITWTQQLKEYDFSFIAGQSINERSASDFDTEVNSQPLEDFVHLSNSLESPVSSEGSSMVRTIGVFASADVAYKNIVYLSLTGRNEWSSTLPKQNNSYFFPGINAGFVFTELIPSIKNALPFGKLRASWAMVGNDAPPYSIESSYQQASHSDGFGYFSYPTNTQVNAYEVGSFIGNQNLKPEMTTEYEFGLDLRFFNNRFSFDVAYYNKLTKDLIWASPVATTSGYSYKMTNLGAIENYGIEALVNVGVIRKSNFSWNISLNFTKNFNKLLYLNDQLENAELNAIRVDGGKQLQWMAIPGQAVGVFEGRAPQYTDDGKMVVDNQGLPIADSELKNYGNSQYNYMAGIINSFNYKGITVGVNFDIRMGGVMYSRTKDISLWAGTGPETVYNNREPFVVPNSVYEIGRDVNGEPIYAENTIPIDAQTLQSFWGNGGLEIDGASLIDKSFVKLRDITIGYTISPKLLANLPFEQLYVGVSGKNLWLWTPEQNYIDPELTTFGNDLSADFGEYGAQPSVRSLSFNIKVDF